MPPPFPDSPKKSTNAHHKWWAHWWAPSFSQFKYHPNGGQRPQPQDKERPWPSSPRPRSPLSPNVNQVFRDNIRSFGGDNYLARCLFLVLGVRKSELCEALWEEFDLEAAVWDLPAHPSKAGTAISIPLPTQAVEWLTTLKGFACGSAYVFPARRASKRPHMGPDTLNRAISKLFGREAGRKQQPPNKMAIWSISPFTTCAAPSAASRLRKACPVMWRSGA